MQKDIEIFLSSVLTPREKGVVTLYLGIMKKRGYSFEEIAFAFGLSKERIRQIYKQAINKLREHPNKDILRSYIGKK